MSVVWRNVELTFEPLAAGPPQVGIGLPGGLWITDGQGRLDVDATLQGLSAAQPGPAVMAVLSSFDAARLSQRQRIEMLAIWERQASWVVASQQPVLAALGRGPAPDDETARFHDTRRPDEDWTREEVAAALHLSPCTAAERLRVAHALASRLPRTWTALAQGEITYRQAVAVADATQPLDADTAAAVERRVLGRAPQQTLGELRRSLRRAVSRADPAAADGAHLRAVTQRRVEKWALADGMAGLYFVLAADDVELAWTVLTGRAEAADCPSAPGIDARRADAFTGMMREALNNAGTPPGTALPRQHGRRPHIQVTVGVNTLLGLDEEPAELAGYGPITAATARRIATDGTWRRLLTDPASGALLDYGRTVYQPPADLAQFVIARDQTCRFPGCAMPARRCEIDHAIEFDSGGTTDRINCGTLCKRHHRAKHRAGWRLQRHPDGACTWTSPAGKTYDLPPPSYHPDG